MGAVQRNMGLEDLCRETGFLKLLDLCLVLARTVAQQNKYNSRVHAQLMRSCYNNSEPEPSCLGTWIHKPHMVVSQNKGTQLQTTKYYNPYDWDPAKVPLILGNLHIPPMHPCINPTRPKTKGTERWAELCILCIPGFRV